MVIPGIDAGSGLTLCVVEGIDSRHTETILHFVHNMCILAVFNNKKLLYIALSVAKSGYVPMLSLEDTGLVMLVH